MVVAAMAEVLPGRKTFLPMNMRNRALGIDSHTGGNQLILLGGGSLADDPAAVRKLVSAGTPFNPLELSNIFCCLTLDSHTITNCCFDARLEGWLGAPDSLRLGSFLEPVFNGHGYHHQC